MNANSDDLCVGYDSVESPFPPGYTHRPERRARSPHWTPRRPINLRVDTIMERAFEGLKTREVGEKNDREAKNPVHLCRKSIIEPTKWCKFDELAFNPWFEYRCYFRRPRVTLLGA